MDRANLWSNSHHNTIITHNHKLFLFKEFMCASSVSILVGNNLKWNVNFTLRWN